MTAHHVDFAAQICATTTSLGRAPKAERGRDLNLALQSLAVFDVNVVALRDASEIGAYIAHQAARFALAEATTATPAPCATLGASPKDSLRLGQLPLRRAPCAAVA